MRKGLDQLELFADFKDDFEGIGRWAQMHLRYIEEQNKALYCELLFAGKLRSYLEKLDT